MILTEEEAKTKTCPHMTYCVNPYHVAADKDPAILEQSPCLGSSCMAWRWARRNHVQAPWGPIPAEDAVLQGFETTPLPDLGYCGLAGIPQGRA